MSDQERAVKIEEFTLAKGIEDEVIHLENPDRCRCVVRHCNRKDEDSEYWSSKAVAGQGKRMRTRN